MRSFTPPDRAGHCLRCLFREEACICGIVSPQATRTRIVVVRHSIEHWKSSGTVRWATVALPGIEVLEYGDPFVRWAPEQLPTADAWVLFPTDAGRPAGPLPETLVVVDGSWTQSRRMMQRIPQLRSLPQLGLPPPAERIRLRRPTVQGGMSSLEALASALHLLGEPGPAESLLRLNDAAVERALALKGLSVEDGWPLPSGSDS